MIGARWRRRIGGAAWFVGVVIAGAWGWVDHQSSLAVRGMGRSEAIDLGAPEEGLLQILEVDLHDPVRSGQVLARFDTRVIEAERDEYAAEALAVADSNHAGSVEALERDRDRRKDLSDRTVLARLETELRRLEALQREGAASPAEVEEVRLDLQRARARIRPEAVDVPMSDWWITSALARMDGAQHRVERMALTSTMDGRVEAIYRRPGEFIRRGDPVLRVRKPETREVVAWVRPGRSPAPGALARVERPDGSWLTGSVLSVGDGPTLLPLQALVDPTRPEWGVAVRLVLQDGSVGPDEPVVVRL